MSTWGDAVAVIALVVAVVAAVLAALAMRRGRRAEVDVDALPADVGGLRGEVAALRREVGGALRHLSLVRYDAFGDSGGHLSWSLALLDDAGDGVVVTSIHGRSEARTYAKTVAAWRSEQQLSPEEQEALDGVRG